MQRSKVPKCVKLDQDLDLEKEECKARSNEATDDNVLQKTKAIRHKKVYDAEKDSRRECENSRKRKRKATH